MTELPSLPLFVSPFVRRFTGATGPDRPRRFVLRVAAIRLVPPSGWIFALAVNSIEAILIGQTLIMPSGGCLESALSARSEFVHGGLDAGEGLRKLLI